MILPASLGDFASLLAMRAPRNLCLAPDTTIAPAEILAMLRDLAAGIELVFSPSGWLIVEGEEVVGLCSITRPPVDGVVDIGYGIAPTRQGSGAASRAVADVVAWASGDHRVRRLTAETAVDNIASQRVLERNGFRRCGERVDPEDGALLCWERDVPGP
jgi:RimJ/RimL family protein N-acetyltransferase